MPSTEKKEAASAPRWHGWLLYSSLAFAVFVAISAWQTRSHPTGVVAPDFTLVDVEGKAYSLQALRGKTVQLHFWATWCGVCRREFGALNAINEDLAEDEVLLTLVRDAKDAKRLKQFMAKHDIRYPVLRATSDVVDAYRVTAFPTNFFIDSEGRIQDSSVGLSSRWSMATRMGCAKR